MKKLLTFIVILVVLILWLWWYLGGFSNLQVEEKEMGPYTMVYVDYVWAYEKVWPVMDEIYQTLTKAGITQTAGIWIYYDDPAITPKDELKSEVWSVINSEDISKVEDLWTSYQIKTIEKSEKVVVAFPYKNMLSYMVGPMKVYPIVNDYMIEKGYNAEIPRIELYYQENKIIYFIAEKQ